MSLGRNIDEVVRVLDALQTADDNACATPANWQKGDKVVVPPPQTIDDAAKRLEDDFKSKNEVTDWYRRSETCRGRANASFPSVLLVCTWAETDHRGAEGYS